MRAPVTHRINNNNNSVKNQQSYPEEVRKVKYVHLQGLCHYVARKDYIHIYMLHKINVFI
jgi:hypothetical protein